MGIKDFVGLFTEYFHVMSVSLCFLFPFLRACIRRYKGKTPIFETDKVIHDVASGFTFPIFLALVLSYLDNTVQNLHLLDGHSLPIAGAVAAASVIVELLRA